MTIVNVVPPRGAPTSAIVMTAPHAPGGPQMSGYSTTESDFAIGEHVFKVSAYSSIYQSGTRLRATVQGNTNHWIEGVASDFDYETNAVKLIADKASGTGSHDDWIINVVGEPGLQGTRGERGIKGDLGLSGGPTGPDGPSGPRGPEGERGPTGEPATIEVGATTTLGEGAQASVTNSGTAGEAIFNFSIPGGGPTGPTGNKGPTGDPGIDGNDVILRDGSRDFTGKIFGISPGATGDDNVLTPASWVRDRIASYVTALGNRVTPSALDDYARLDGAGFIGPVEFMTGPPPNCIGTPIVAANSAMHALWHDGLIDWEDQANGYILFPNKFMVQWGHAAGGADTWRNFPTSFTQCYGVWALPIIDLPDQLITCTVDHVASSNFAFRLRLLAYGTVWTPVSYPFWWLAIGHRK